MWAEPSPTSLANGTTVSIPSSINYDTSLYVTWVDSTITAPANSRGTVSAGTAAAGAISDQVGPTANTSSGTVSATGSASSNWGEVTLAIAPPVGPGWAVLL